MLNCPFCQTDLSADGIEAGRCFACGSLVMWQEDDSDEVLRTGEGGQNVAVLTSTPKVEAQPVVVNHVASDGESLGGAAPVGTIMFSSDSVQPVDSRVSAGRGSANAPPLEQLKSVWQLPDSVTPRTSLKAPAGNRLDSEQSRRLQTLWQGSISGSSQVVAGANIKDSRAGQRRSTLVIGARTLHDMGEPGLREADYELLDRIGEGGMGVVYEARQACMDRIVAVKMLHGHIASDYDQRDKFLSEAVITAELDHPNIVPIHDLGSNEVGDLFYSMKRVQGTPWSDGVKSKSLDENLEILLKVCDAIAFAHQKGVIHRDLKPENIMLGDFGEVLVMDWGLAMPTNEFRRSESITQSCSMGGTPAYMAPEMATGPIDAIGKRSDIYLLGALLYEVITGDTPHTGKDTMDCLYAAARNDIQPTAETGELLEIAMEAMATQPEDRFATVQEFRDAIRSYQAHVESITLSTRAASELRSALESHNYQEYAAALYGYKEALALWGGNVKAGSGLKAAALAYARSAVDKEDFDLAASLLDPAEPRHRELGRAIDIARRERANRSQRLRHLRLLAVIMAAVLFGTIFIAYFWIRRDRNAAIAAADYANKQTRLAEEASEQLAENLDEIKTLNQEANDARTEAEAERDAADRAKAAEEYESYLAKIQLVAEKIDANAYREAKSLLELVSSSRHRNWEWGRLQYLCQEFATRWDTSGQIEDVALAPNGKTFGAVCGSGFAWIWKSDADTKPLQLPHAGKEVHTLAFGPDSTYVITGDADGTLRAFDIATAEMLVEFQAHQADILALDVAHDVKRLITSSYDKSIIVWDITDIRRPSQLQRYPRHAFILDIDVTSDGRLFVTGGQDGYATVWQQADEGGVNSTYSPIRQFSAHKGAVHCVALAPDGMHVASGGYDKRIMVWDLRKIEPIDLQKIASGIASEPPVYRALDGHRSPVQSVSFSPDGTRIVSGSMDNTVRVWDSTTGELYKTLRGHAFGVRSCLFANDGTAILSGSHDKTVRLWNVGDYREVRMLNNHSLAGHSDAILSAKYSNDGLRIVTCGRDRTAIVWDAHRQTLIARLAEGHDYMATNVRFFPDGTRMLTGGGDDTVRIWDVVAGSQILQIDHAGRNGVIALSHDARTLLTGDKETVHVWDVRNGERLQTLVHHKTNVSALAFSHDGNWLSTADTNGVIGIWRTGSDQPAWSTRGHSGMVTACHFLPGDKRLITASGDNTVTQWDVATGEEISDTTLPHPGWVSQLVLSPDGSRAVTACDDSVVRVWSLDECKLLGTLEPSPTSDTLAHNLRRHLRAAKWTNSELANAISVTEAEVAEILERKWLPDEGVLQQIATALKIPLSALRNPKVEGISLSGDGKFVLTSISHQRACRLWNLDTLQETTSTGEATEGKPFLQLSQGGILWSAEFSPDTDQIATIGGNEVRLWSFHTGREEMTFCPHGTVSSASFSPDGHSIVTAGWDSSAKVWNVETGVATSKLIGGHEGRINDVVYSPNGEQIATASDDGTVCLWDAMTGERLETRLVGHSDSVMSVRYSPDGKEILTASSDRTVRLWNAMTGELCRALVDRTNDEGINASQDAHVGPAHQLGVLCAEFLTLPDSRLCIITGSDDATAKIWQADNGKLLQALHGHIGPVTSVGISPDGQRVFTGSRDATAKLWDTATGKEVLTLTGHERDITAINFAPSGRDVVTGSLDGLAIIWPSEPWMQSETTKPMQTTSLRRGLNETPTF